MSTTHNNRYASSHWLLGTLLNLTQMLLLIALAGGLILVVPASAQSTEAPNTTTGSVLGTVVDSNNDTIPNATVVLQKPVGDPLTVVTEDNGSFAFHGVTPGIAYQITIAAEGFAGWAGVQQARDNPDEWRQGAKGYGKRLGAGFADATTGSLITNAILPSLLHQDPRYFYQGTGTKWSRARHAMLAPFVCKGDNGATQPNYSQWGGSLIGYSISSAYYPSSSRTAGHVFDTSGIDMDLHVFGSLA